jgi:CheY-like chemotaxis protein
MRVLVVEDEVRMARLLKRALEEKGHAVDVAGTGPDGLWLATENPYAATVLARVPWSRGPHHRSCPHRGAGRAGIDTVADSRNEPSFNPAMGGVELLTPLPIGLGTRFRTRLGSAGTEMLVELTAFDRPRRLRSRTTSSMMIMTQDRLTVPRPPG